MRGLIRKTEKPTKKKQRKRNKKEMARDEPTNKKGHAVAGHLSHRAEMSGARSNLTTSVMVRSGHCLSVTTQGWDPAGHPALPRPPPLLASHPAFLRDESLDHLPKKHCKCRFPGLLKNLGWALESAFSISSQLSLKHAQV